MAKRGILEHEKTMMLAEELDIMDCFAMGVLEAFWHFVAKYRMSGDLTGLTPRLLARSIRYTGDAQDLWDALVKCRWVDVEGEKASVHDWSEHADNAVHQVLKDRGELFADGVTPFSRNRARKVSKESKSGENKSDESTSDGENHCALVSGLQAACKPLTSGLYVPEPEPEPEPEAKTPLTPAERGSVVSISPLAELEAAVTKLQRECNLPNPRLRKKLAAAMRLEASKTDDPPGWNEIAELMIRQQREYVHLGELGVLRYSVGMGRFFGEGLWRDDGLWGIDREEVRRRSAASVGTG